MGWAGGRGAPERPAKARLRLPELPRLSETTHISTRARVVVLGDLHGDYEKAVAALRLAGVLGVGDEGAAQWTGGDTVLVQLGDILDRGDRELAILSLLQLLQRQARAAGGDVLLMNGNHESLNVMGDFRYVTPGGFSESTQVVRQSSGLPDSFGQTWEEQLKSRLALFSPGGPIARQLAQHYTVLQVNDTVFARRRSGLSQRRHVRVHVVFEQVDVHEGVDLVGDKVMGSSSATMRASGPSR